MYVYVGSVFMHATYKENFAFSFVLEGVQRVLRTGRKPLVTYSLRLSTFI